MVNRLCTKSFGQALFMVCNEENMNPLISVGVLIIIITVIANGVLKQMSAKKNVLGIGFPYIILYLSNQTNKTYPSHGIFGF